MKVFIIIKWDGVEHSNYSVFRFWDDTLLELRRLRAENPDTKYSWEEWEVN